MGALLVVVWRSLFSLHTSVVSDELHAVDCFSDFNFVWDVVAYICNNINQKSKPSEREKKVHHISVDIRISESVVE